MSVLLEGITIANRNQPNVMLCINKGGTNFLSPFNFVRMNESANVILKSISVGGITFNTVCINGSDRENVAVVLGGIGYCALML
jgi:hypothetical protein